jgi:formamidopyrimidine-DNA glycosylase
MTGSFQVYEDPADRPRFWKLEVVLDDGTRIAMPNARRLGRIRLIEDPPREPPICHLGFDPLLNLPAADEFSRLLAARRAPIKAVLLDQSFAAGVGNWIADEVLYQARIDPRRRACDLPPACRVALRAKLRQVIRRAVAVDADNRRFPRTWLFHVRWGKKKDARTVAGQKIRHITVAGRTTAYVPSRQR